MAKIKSIKLKDNYYINSANIVHNRKKLSNLIDENGIAKYENGSIDPNVTLYDLILTRHSNAQVKTSGEFYYIKTMFYQRKSTTSNRAQISFGYRKNHIAYRYYNGTWSEWEAH